MFDWDKLRIFHTVSNAGSFTKAADLMNLSQSAISRQINSLEESLGVPLFHRNPRGLVLTTQGEILSKTVRDVFARLSMTEALLNEGRGNPRGPLKVTTSVTFGSLWLAPRLPLFLTEHPDIELKLILRDDEPDISMRDTDISIPCRPSTQSDLVCEPLVQYPFRIYGNRAYLQKHGVPVKAADLDRHRLIVFGNEPPNSLNDVNWLLRCGRPSHEPRSPVLILNNVQGILSCVKAGVGLASLHRFVVQNESDVIEVLPEIDKPHIQRYMVYAEQLKSSRRITAFRRFLMEETEKDQNL